MTVEENSKFMLSCNYIVETLKSSFQEIIVQKHSSAVLHWFKYSGASAVNAIEPVSGASAVMHVQ